MKTELPRRSEAAYTVYVTAKTQDPAPCYTVRMQDNVLGLCLGEEPSFAPLAPGCVKIRNSLKNQVGLTRAET